MLDSLQTDSTLSRLLEKSGTVYEIGGNTPFLVDDPRVAWYVISGTVELFTVRVTDKEPSGPRSHFFSAKSGDILPGIDLERFGQGLGLLAVGVAGTKVCKIPFELIQTVGCDARFTDEICRRIESWVAGLSHGVTKSIYPQPRAEHLIEPADEVDLEDGQKARAKKGVVWARFEGTLLFIGMEEVSLPNQRALFPLSHESWMQSISTTKFILTDTKTAIVNGSAWDGLEALYEVLFKCEFFNTSLAAVDEYNRLKKKAERDRIVREESLQQLASIMTEERQEGAGIELDDPLFAACSAVGRAARIRFVAPSRMKEGEKRRDPLGDIVKASRIRMRDVVLSKGWWTKENGPLLAYLEQDHRPVALLPDSRSGYELFDPVKGIKISVTPKLAKSLSEMAVTFYRPFPNEAISFRQLLRFGGFGSRKDLRNVVIVGICIGLLALVTPMATGAIFDTIVPEAERGQLVQIGLALLVSAIAAALFMFTQSIAVLRVEGRFDSNVNAAIMDRLLCLPVPFFRKYSAGDLASRAAGITEIRRLLSGTVLVTIVTSIFSLISFALLFYYSWILALIATAITIVAVGVTFFASYLQLRHQRRVRDFEGRIAGIILQLITGISKLRVAAAEAHAFAYWAKEFASQKKMMFRARTVANNLLIFNSVLPVVSLAIIFAAVAFQPQSLSTGSFLAFNAAFTQFLAAAILLSTATTLILGLVPIYERARPILQSLPEVNEAKAFPGELNGEIELSHVSFRYETDGPLILKDVSLQIQPGEFVAIVGPSGTGKSTLFRLLLGFEKPERGSIHYDGLDLAVLDIQAVRRQIGVVLQHSRVMTGDIFRNIVGAAPLTVDDAWEAARKAGIAEDIKMMPMGMHTVINEGGGTFSGGQRQRILIARAIALNPRILLFDEATSALDNRTQAIVSESLQRLQATRVVIAHRLSTVINADRILVFEGGRFVQSGTYEELMNQPGLFVELAKRQLH